ncbi:MAG: tRNA (adenosine(37)-N6)-threonylcarbamoyltransferase complex dimerization subunit type 1 TsaB [Syntrophomonadaceae bacterium]|nr:tRNA (adenosine(37)-N6)-threonylcarbamoyltransferase complex dimerization subunit type 1 TsaB [Syntrophomonadaceae bacterium]
MLILAVDSATQVAGVALVARDRVIREEFVNFGKKHSEILLPLIDRVMKESECDWGQITALAVTVGPGSFTGLRIGMATVKGLSMATGLPIAAIPTLEVLAHNLAGSQALVATVLDARRQEVYFCCYDVAGSFPRNISPITACSPERAALEITASLDRTGRERVIIVGDGAITYRDYFADYFGERLLPVGPHLMFPRAAALGSLAWQAVDAQTLESGLTVKPLYIRLSEAEYRLEKGVTTQ